MCQIKITVPLLFSCSRVSEADDLEWYFQDKPGIRRKVCQIKITVPLLFSCSRVLRV